MNKFHSVLHLVLQSVPKPRTDSAVSSEEARRAKSEELVTPERSQQQIKQRRSSLDSSIEPPMIHVDGR